MFGVTLGRSWTTFQRPVEDTDPSDLQLRQLAIHLAASFDNAT